MRLRAKAGHKTPLHWECCCNGSHHHLRRLELLLKRGSELAVRETASGKSARLRDATAGCSSCPQGVPSVARRRPVTHRFEHASWNNWNNWNNLFRRRRGPGTVVLDWAFVLPLGSPAESLARKPSQLFRLFHLVFVPRFPRCLRAKEERQLWNNWNSLGCTAKPTRQLSIGGLSVRWDPM